MNKIVFESLMEYHDSYYESLLLNESFISEKLDMKKVKGLLSKVKDKSKMIINLLKKFNSTISFKTKKYIAILLLILVSITNGQEFMMGATLDKAANDIASTSVPATEKMVLNIIEKLPEDKINSELSLNNKPHVIDQLNKINPNRFSIDQLDIYDQYDKEIAEGIKELEQQGLKPNFKLIKAIMLVETGMNPRKNSGGYQGFPQTKMHIVKGINKRFGTNFSKSDLYDAKESAKFIHYLITAIKKSRYVENNTEAVASYNWGLGNFSKYKVGKKEMPAETRDYTNLISILLKA